MKLNYINCTAHGSSEGNLLIGDERAALFDCGMAFCAGETVRNVKNALGAKTLDYIFITHTHYDHAGALPFFREAWPELRLVTCGIGAAALLKDTPRRVIRELSHVAAKRYGGRVEPYSDGALRADIIIKDGDSVPLGGFSVKAVETPGHTKDSLSYFIPEAELFILSESTGVFLPGADSIHSAYLSSYGDTVRSFEKCRREPYKYLSLPHRGIFGQSKEEADRFFEEALAETAACRDFILDMHAQGLGEDRMLDLFTEKYANETRMRFQPEEAFAINARAVIACTLREREVC